MLGFGDHVTVLREPRGPPRGSMTLHSLQQEWFCREGAAQCGGRGGSRGVKQLIWDMGLEWLEG